MPNKPTIDEMTQTAEELADRWVRGFLTDTIENLAAMDGAKAAFVCGSMVAIMHRDSDSYTDERSRLLLVDRFLNRVAERYYDGR